jgi:chromosomal replication initiator protein
LLISTEKAWDKSLHIIKDEIGDSLYELWFNPIKVIKIKDGDIVLEVPNRFFKEWIEDYHPTLISDVLKKVTSEKLDVKYKIAAKEDTAIKKADAKLEKRKNKLAGKGIYLNPKYTFDSFVVGPSNQFADAACKAVSEAPGRVYNPLFLYGGVGLGKTHLVTSVGNSVVDLKRDFNVLYVSAEQFTNEVVSAFRHRKTEEFKEKYRNLDLLLIDDVQFVEGKNATQEELFHTLNALYDRQKQIVLSSDRPPKDIKEVTDRLRSRFSMGLTADIQAPEVETKIAIIHKKSEADGISLPEDVIYFIASRIKSNIRDIEGCLIRLGAHSSLSGSPVNLEMAKSILKDFIPEDEKPLSVETIMKTVAEHFGIRIQEMKARKRTKEIALPRQVAMYLARELTESSLNEIGKTIGGKNHATVIYAGKQIEERKSKDENFNRLIEGLRNKITT